MSQPSLLQHIGSTIADDIRNIIDSLCIHYRLHWRIKESDSLKDKIKSKGDGYYSFEGKKVQDIIGFRITTYFYDDVKILWDIFRTKYQIIDEEYDTEKVNIFAPLRKNMVCKMPKDLSTMHQSLTKSDDNYALTDDTFEIQFRSTFSEGWHEIDHALRYKCKDDWSGYEDEERFFNGTFAALESIDRMLKSLFEDLAYNHYKQKNWEAMLRTKFRLHFHKTPFSLSAYLDNNPDLAKIIIRCDRESILTTMARYNIYIPMNYDNLFWLIMYLEAPKDHEVHSKIPIPFLTEWNFRTK